MVEGSYEALVARCEALEAENEKFRTILRACQPHIESISGRLWSQIALALSDEAGGGSDAR